MRTALKNRLAYKTHPKNRTRKPRSLVPRTMRPRTVAVDFPRKNLVLEKEIAAAKTFGDLKTLAAKYHVPGRSKFKAADRGKLEEAIREAA